MATEDKNPKYSTSSFYPACFCLAKGLHLVGIDRTNPSRCTFVFQDSPEREKWLNDFNFAPENDPSVLVDARRLINSIKALKEKLHQNQ